MKHALRQFQWLTPLFLIALLVGGGGRAEAQYQSGSIQGDYAFSVHFTCVDTTAGFGPNFSVNPVPVSGFTRKVGISTRGTLSFNLNGTATQTSFTTFVNLNSVSFPVSEGENTCSYIYTVDPDGTATVQGTCTGTTVAGGGIGNTLTTTGVVFKMLIVQGGNVLLNSPEHPPGIRTVTVTPPTPPGGPPPTPTVFERVCASSGVAHRIHR